MFDPNAYVFSLESAARTAASELEDMIVMTAQSPADVPQLIEQVVAFMRDEWAKTDWNSLDGYGDDPLKR